MIDHNLYVACLDLKDRPCLVVGAGAVAFEKIEGLLVCGARVRVVARRAISEIEDLAAAGEIELVLQAFDPGDLDGHFVVIAATSDTDVNVRVFEEAEERAMLVNVVDVPALCNFILPAIVRLGPLAVAVSTSGASPALAKRLRREIESVLGPHHARLAEMLDDLRPWAKQELATYQERKLFFESIVEGTPDPVESLRAGDEEGVRALIEDAQRRAAS